jgi:membrane protein insertase Oxa1/YidC/SpoIIIJ
MFSQPLPKEGQARQTAMMTRIMPFVFFVFIYSLPSAFVLYFTASSIIGFVENRMIKHQLKKAKEAREAAAGSGDKGGGQKAGPQESGGKGAAVPDPSAFWQAEGEKKKGKKKR